MKAKHTYQTFITTSILLNYTNNLLTTKSDNVKCRKNWSLYSNVLYVALVVLQLKYLCLNAPRLGALRTDSGRVFQILGPEYAKVFR